MKELFEDIRAQLESMKDEDEFTLLLKLKQLTGIVQKKCNEIREHEAAVQREVKIKALKALKPQSKVWTRLTGDLFGKTLFKIKDGKDYMLIAGNGKQFRIKYDYIQDHPLNEMELRLGKIWNHVTNI